MASQFFIQVDLPDDPSQAARVRMHDDDQDDYTDWVEVPARLRGQPLETLFAAAVEGSLPLQHMVEMAKQVAYAVYINDEAFDIHEATPARYAALLQQAHLDGTTQPAQSPATRRRM